MPASLRTPPSLQYRWLVLLGLVLGVVALLPWWWNRNYVRDFYDYGLVIAGLGLMEQGQHPYVDFATPIQAGFFGLSRLAEKLGGNDYLGLTWGGGGLILIMVTGLTAMLARRWPGGIAAAIALAVTVASASQHTILWHNALGVGCLALVVWSAALAPVWRRADWPWHVLTALGLCLGGVNKMNFHLVALAAACAWSARAALLGRASWGRASVTCWGWALFGGIIPVALELLWTGASWPIWVHNVVGLAAASRADTLADIFHWSFLFRPIHDYYGPLALPQVGLVGVVITVMALCGCRPMRGVTGRARWDWLLLPVALILAATAGAALLATNQEIAYVGLSAWVVLIVGIWLGFAPDRPRPRWFAAGLLCPTVVFGMVAWISAWSGQRSQFGYSNTERAQYQLAETAGPDFAYLRGVRLPPETWQGLTLLHDYLPAVGADGLRPVFYGAGTEWLQRIFPGLRRPGQPLWVHWGTTYGPREIWDLVRRFDEDLRQQVVLAQLARDQWPPALAPTLQRFYRPDLLGPVIRRWSRISHVNECYADAITFADLAGGNVAGGVLRTEEKPFMVALPFNGDRIMLGVMGGEGLIRMSEPCYQFGGDAVLERAPDSGAGALYADFKVIEHSAVPEIVRWSGRVELAAGQNQMVRPFTIDAQGKNLQLRVKIPDAFGGKLSAGYRNLQINHALESPGGPPRLRAGVSPDQAPSPELTELLFGAVAWRPRQVVLRGASGEKGVLLLQPGGELWIQTDGKVGEIFGQVTLSDPVASRPTVRAVWYKGGRLQITQQGQVAPNHAFDFHVWSAEPGGWMGILIDPAGGETGAAAVQLTAARFQP